MLSRQAYPNDLSDQEWNLISPVVTFKRTPRGRKGIHSKREMLDAIFYLLRTGCQWLLNRVQYLPLRWVNSR